MGLRDIRFNRNLCIAAFAVAAYLSYLSWTDFSPLDWRSSALAGAAYASMAATLVVVGLYLLWTTRFLLRHIGEPNTFFIDFDRRARRRYVRVLYFLFLPLTALTVSAVAAGLPLVGGALVGPTGVIDFLAIGNLTHGIRLLDE